MNQVTMEHEILGMLGRECMSLKNANCVPRIHKYAAVVLFAGRHWWAT